MTTPAHDISHGPPLDRANRDAPAAPDQRHAAGRRVSGPTPASHRGPGQDGPLSVPRRPRCGECGELLLPAQRWVREADGWWFHYQCHALAGTTGRAQALGW